MGIDIGTFAAAPYPQKAARALPVAFSMIQAHTKLPPLVHVTLPSIKRTCAEFVGVIFTVTTDVPFDVVGVVVNEAMFVVRVASAEVVALTCWTTTPPEEEGFKVS